MREGFLKRRTPDHPKVISLEERLKIPRFAAVGLLELLWHYTAEYAPQGSVGKYPDSAIARACHWPKDAAAFVDALVETGWLDRDEEYRLLVHDWADHVDETTKKRLLRAKLEIIIRQPNGSRAAPERLPLSALEAANGSLARGGDGQGGDGRGKAEPTDEEKRFWIASTMLEFPGAKILGRLPDERIVAQCYELAQGDMELLARAFRALHLTGQKPTISWAWFPKVLPKYMESVR